MKSDGKVLKEATNTEIVQQRMNEIAKGYQKYMNKEVQRRSEERIRTDAVGSIEQ